MSKITSLASPAEFTLCIPSYNRGTRLLAYLKSITANLNESWPILVLDNASSIQRDDYKAIEEMSHVTPGLNYIRHENNLLFEGNFLSMFDLVQTDFFMVISDEDETNFDFVRELCPQLPNLKEVGAIRPSLGPKANSARRQSTIFEDKLFAPGPEAISRFGLTGNYISGAIYNRKLLTELGFVLQLEKNMLEHRTYPHLYMNILAAGSTKTLFMSDISCFESLPEEVSSREIDYFGAYSFGSRTDQFLALRNAMLEAILNTNEDFDAAGFYQCYMTLCTKYLMLVAYVNSPMYEAHSIEHATLARTFVLFCLASAQKMPAYREYSAVVEQHLTIEESRFCSKYQKNRELMASRIQRDIESLGIEKAS
jgi:hypothetical protein